MLQMNKLLTLCLALHIYIMSLTMKVIYMIAKWSRLMNDPLTLVELHTIELNQHLHLFEVHKQILLGKK